MAVSLRLDEQIDRKLAEIAEQKGVTKSELIRQCLMDFVDRYPPSTPWELGKDLFGCEGSGREDLSRCAEEIVRKKIHARRNRR